MMRAGVVIGTLLGASAAFGQAIPIVLSGQHVPGFGPDTVFAGFADQRYEPDGSVVFWAQLAGPDIDNDHEQSLWAWRDGQLDLLLQSGSPVPWRTGARLVAITQPVLDAQGVIVFHGAVDAPDITIDDDIAEAHNAGLFALSFDSSIRTLAQKGAAAPGLPVGQVLSDIGAVARNAAGVTAFAAGDGTGMWTVQPAGDPVLVARADDPVFHYAVELGTLEYIDEPTLAPTGRLTFRASLARADVLATDRVLVEPEPATGQLVATRHTGAIGLAGGATILRDIALRGIELTDGDGVRWESMDRATPQTDTGLGLTKPLSNNTRSIVVEGSPVPGLAGVDFGRVEHEVRGNDQSDFVLLAWLRDASDGSPIGQGIFRCDLDGGCVPVLVARSSDPAPDQPAGVTLRFLESPMLTNTDTVVFAARVQGPGVEPTTARMLIAQPDLGPMRSAVREGDQIAVDAGGGDLRVVRSLAMVPTQSDDGRAAARDRACVVQLDFTDDSTGLFLISVDPLDFHADGRRDAQDFFAFLEALVNHDPRADLTGNGAWNVNDYLFFLDHFQ